MGHSEGAGATGEGGGSCRGVSCAGCHLQRDCHRGTSREEECLYMLAWQ